MESIHRFNELPRLPSSSPPLFNDCKTHNCGSTDRLPQASVQARSKDCETIEAAQSLQAYSDALHLCCELQLGVTKFRGSHHKSKELLSNLKKKNMSMLKKVVCVAQRVVGKDECEICQLWLAFASLFSGPKKWRKRKRLLVISSP